MAEYDIIEPSFPPPVTDPPTTSYPYLGSIGVPNMDLRNSCIKEVEVISVDALANTIGIRLDSVEHLDVPVWIHTDYGCRRRYIQGKEATNPVDYFERAACLFPFTGGVKIGAGIYDTTLTPKALALVHIDPVTLLVTIKGIVSVVQSVEKKRDTIDNVCFSTWRPYVKIRFQGFRYTVAAGEEYKYNASYTYIVKKSDGVTIYAPSTVSYRTIVWDLLEDAIAVIPNAARDGYVNADTEDIGGNPATVEEINSFTVNSVKEYDPRPVSFLEAQPWCTTTIVDPQSSPFGTYVDYDGSTHGDAAWNGTTSGSANWSEVVGSYSGSWSGELNSVSTQLDKWATHPDTFWPLRGAFSSRWYYDTSDTGYILGSQNRLSNGGNYRATFTLDGKGYVVNRYVKDFNFSSVETDEGELGWRNYKVNVAYNYSFYLDIVTDGVSGTGYDIQCSSSLMFDGGESSESLLKDSAYQVITTRQEPSITFSSSFLTGETGIITSSVSSVIATTSESGENVTLGIQDRLDTNYTYIFGKDIMGTGLFVDFLDSVHDVFHEPGNDSENNPAILVELGEITGIFTNDCLYTPDSIHVKDMDYLMIPYNLKDAEILA